MKPNTYKVECIQDHCYSITSVPFIYRVTDANDESVQVTIDFNHDDNAISAKCDRDPSKLIAISDVLALLAIIEKARTLAYENIANKDIDTDSEFDAFAELPDEHAVVTM